MAARPQWNPPIAGWTETLCEGFGSHFQTPFANWCRRYLNTRELELVGLRARVTWMRSQVHQADCHQFAAALWHADSRRDDRVLAAMDGAAYELSGASGAAIYELSRILEAGGSAWRVRDDGCGLERRVPEAFREATADVIVGCRCPSPTQSFARTSRRAGVGISYLNCGWPRAGRARVEAFATNVMADYAG